ncbi:MAG: nuclear transport factor 2 family protein [Gemmatimonadota bacterium]|nr:nuclear transport factor 2 family protein [Gemmatimonadota bacterium]
MRGCVVGIVLLVSACGPPWGPPPDPRELMDADRAFAAETAARGGEGWAAWFAPEARQYLSGGGFLAGRDSIRAVMVPAFADTTRALRWAPDSAVVAASGDIGYTFGRWHSVVRTPAGDSISGRGNYVSIWRRQPDGTWKVVIDIGNTAGEGR